MAPIVAANAMQVTISGTAGGRPFANVFGGFITGGGTAVGLAQDIVEAYVDNFVPNLPPAVIVQSASFVDLRSLSGDSGPVPGTTLPETGANDEEMAPPNVCWLVHWAVGGGRNTRNGRTYLPGVLEAGVNANGTITGSIGTDLTAAITAFLAQITGGDNGDLGVLANP